MNVSSIQLARYILSFIWVYHGVFPKLLTIAPIEQQLIATLNFSTEHSYLITKFAGVFEIIFGIILFVLYKNKTILLLNISVLVMLCVFVAIQLPSLLIEAFNPITTNLSLVGLSYILYQNKAQID
jgi:hypothetical protein